MPRVAQPPRATGRPGTVVANVKPVTKIPLNDDREEKAIRFQSRQALHEIQLNQIKAAASPARRRRSLGPIGAESPRTPNSQDKENHGSPGLNVVGGGGMSPMKRVPILANFEEWMKMATDNKINATNSWNFALIDYFHDMSLLKEGDGVNFQKASCTLDGCVKIYTSRVDSVATETGKLLSGLADSRGKKQKDEGEDGAEDDDDDEDSEEGGKKRAKKRVQRSSEATLATSFAQLQLKKMELEFSVDPLFKKASADFDEGGAKGLLLNHLTMDNDGRIVFDSSDDTKDVGEDNAEAKAEQSLSQLPPAEEGRCQTTQIEIESLASRFFPNLAKLDEQDICPSLKNFELGGASDVLDIPFLKASDDWKSSHHGSNKSKDGLQTGEDGGFGLDDDEPLDGFNIGDEVGFGEGGEVWAKEAAINTQSRTWNAVNEGEGEEDGAEVGGFQAESVQYGVTISQGGGNDHENILSYFDQALQKNWAGPEHWRIRKIKDSTKPPTPATSRRKEKEAFEIDFAAPLSQAQTDILYTRASSNSAISLPRAQWKSRTRNLLPDDKHFNSQQLLRLFLKPKARIGARRTATTSNRHAAPVPEGGMDEAFWAREQHNASAQPQSSDADLQGNYDANFFQDDGLNLPPLPGDEDDDDVAFADAREAFSPGAESRPQLSSASQGIDGILDAANGMQEALGTQLVTQSRRSRPEYVQYARVAKKVDVRRLKEEMWRGLGLEETLAPAAAQKSADPSPTVNPSAEPLRFTSIMNSLQSVYPAQAMADISTSYCFICLLHLANEKGLLLNNDAAGRFEEISIVKDWSAEITEGVE